MTKAFLAIYTATSKTNFGVVGVGATVLSAESDSEARDFVRKHCLTQYPIELFTGHRVAKLNEFDAMAIIADLISDGAITTDQIRDLADEIDNGS